MSRGFLRRAVGLPIVSMGYSRAGNGICGDFHLCLWVLILQAQPTVRVAGAEAAILGRGDLAGVLLWELAVLAASINVEPTAPSPNLRGAKSILSHGFPHVSFL